MEQQERILKNNVKEFYDQGLAAYQKESYNSAVTLFFKAIAVLVDLFLLQEKGSIPKDHSQRFRILEDEYRKLYKILDRDFPLYQDSYRLELGQDYAEVLKDDLETVSTITGIDIESA